MRAQLYAANKPVGDVAKMQVGLCRVLDASLKGAQ